MAEHWPKNKFVRARLDDMETAQMMMEGLNIYYNFVRPHTALNGKTPAQKAKIKADRAKWMSLVKKARQHQRFETSS